MTKYFIGGVIITFAVTWYVLEWSLMPTLIVTAVGGLLAQVIATLLMAKSKKKVAKRGSEKRID
jgi:hypothetical protein